jgi:hypothetical protein
MWRIDSCGVTVSLPKPFSFRLSVSSATVSLAATTAYAYISMRKAISLFSSWNATVRTSFPSDVPSPATEQNDNLIRKDPQYYSVSLILLVSHGVHKSQCCRLFIKPRWNRPCSKLLVVISKNIRMYSGGSTSLAPMVNMYQIVLRRRNLSA